ncbi:MAG: glycosyltransferase family 2 protein [Barnesiella sp.]
MEPKVSIVIPVYKTESYLVGSVNSVIRQTYNNKEIILVDDGSPDDCPGICDEFAKENENIQVIHKKNGGLSSARNAGMQKATGKYILFLDSDDQLVQDAISIMVGKAEREGLDAVYPNSYYKVYENNTEKKYALHFKKDAFSNDPKVFALDVVIGKGRARRSTAVLYDLDIMKNNAIEFPYGLISEDVFFNLDFLLKSNKIGMIEEPTLLCLKRNGSISTSFYKNFFDTIILMDNKVESFIKNIDSSKYNNVIKGKRESLLFRNVLIYVIQVMVDKNIKYAERKALSVKYMDNCRVRDAFKNKIEFPYFEGTIQKIFMIVSILLMKYRCYTLLCFLANIAGKNNKL